MARTIVALTDDVWTDLGTGSMIVTVHKQGSTGHLLLNNSQTDSSSLLVNQGRVGHQFSNNVAADTFSVKATGPGWEVAFDFS